MNAELPNLRKLLALAVLCMMMLFGQQQTLRHALMHVVEVEQTAIPGEPTKPHCDTCDSLAAFGASLPAADAAPWIGPHGVPYGALVRGRSAPATAVATGYLSRAPPQQT